MDKKITNSEIETIDLGFDFSKKLKLGDTVFLIGNLGSGKTTFVKGLAKGLGITKRIISPTFVIVRIYEFGKTLNNNFYHLDLYRLNDEKSLKTINYTDILNDKNGIKVIEWPEISQNLVDKKVWKIAFKNIDEAKREIEIKYE